MKKIAGIELAGNGIGVSTSARIYARKYYAGQGNSVWSMARNDKINDLLAGMFSSGNIEHRFKLKSGEIAEISNSNTFYFIAVMRRGNYDIIKIQESYKPVSEKSRKQRLESDNW
jgi:hypothetical protein